MSEFLFLKMKARRDLSRVRGVSRDEAVFGFDQETTGVREKLV